MWKPLGFHIFFYGEHVTQISRIIKSHRNHRNHRKKVTQICVRIKYYLCGCQSQSGIYINNGMKVVIK
jgi:hypothetical protein